MGFEEEKRSYNRLNHPFVSKFRVADKTSPLYTENWDMVRIRNISAGGLSFNYNNKIPVGTILEFNLQFVGVVKCMCTVCRIDEPDPNQKSLGRILIYNIAAKYIDITDEQREAINKLVKEFQK